MNRTVKKRRILWGLPIILASLAVFTVIFIFNSQAIASDKVLNGRVITIHDSGNQQIIVSQAQTIADVLDEADITLESNDIVEPSLETELVASDYQVNIYRSRPVIVIDGGVRIKVMTPYQTAEQIVEDAGIKLYAEDETELAQTDIVTEGAGLKLTIKRAKVFQFDLYGKTITARSQADTIGDMLAEKSIELDQSDKVSPDQDEMLTNGINVRVWREGKQTITVDESVDFEITQIESADYNAGYKEIRSNGIEGERTVTYEIVIENGVEVSRTEINSLITKQPIDQIELIGIKGQYNTPSENENITWQFLIEQGFSEIQTAGIMGNLMQEHHFYTSDTPNGLGIAQWTGGRRQRLIDMYPDSYTSIYSQLEFLMYELNGSYVSVKNAILSSNSLSESVTIFQNSFERCNPVYCNLDNRLNYASDILASH